MASRVVYIDQHGSCVLAQPPGERSWSGPEPLERSVARVLEESGIDFSDARIRAGFGRGHLMDIVVYTRAVALADAASVRQAAAQLVERLLGQRTFEHWVDSVDVALLSRVSSLPVLNTPQNRFPSHPLNELLATVNAAIQGVLEGLPERPCFEQLEQASWTMFELEPEAASDYAAQDDLLLATTSLPEMLKSYLRGAPFHSGRFSRRGEVFCFLKYEDDADDTAERRLEQRRGLEDALNGELVPAALGCVIGNGLGVRYSYVDFALTDVARAIDAIRRVAATASVGERAWVLFCDSTWSREWIGIHDDRAPPPFLA
jgi:hypothetical protein